MDVQTSTAEAPQITLESLAADIQDLRLRVARQVTRDVARRNKLLALQAAVVRRHGDAVCDSDDVIAPVFPIERVAHAKPMARILAFGSMGDNFGMTTTEFFKQLQAFDVEVYFFKDFEQIWYMKGLLGLSTDIDSTVAVIRGMLPDDGLPILTLGASSGGFAALLFGRLLGAARTIAFSPQSEVSRQVFSRFKSVDSNDEDFEIIKAYGSLRKVYDETPATGKARIFFAERAPHDAQQARLMEGCEGVTMAPLPWNGHNTANFLKLRGQLQETLSDFVHGTGSFAD